MTTLARQSHNLKSPRMNANKREYKKMLAAKGTSFGAHRDTEDK